MSAARPQGRWTGLALGALLLHLVLIQPNHPGAMTWGALRLFPLELVPLLALVVAAGPRARVLHRLVAGLLVLLVALKAADLGFFVALGRGFNPVTDAPLLVAALRLAGGTAGWAVALAGAITLMAALALLGWLLARTLGVWAALAPGRGWRAGAAALALAGFALVVAETGHTMRQWRLPADPPGAAFTFRLGVERFRLARATLADLAAFRAAAAEDPMAGAEGLLDRLKGRDVLVVFVESYGRASFDNPLYAPAHDAVRARGAAALSAAGLAARSGWLASPVEGGQSWLAHTSLAAGLRVDSQGRHAALLASPRRTLYQLAADAGYRTVAVVPAITLAWPEAGRLGFQTVLDARALAYRGKPFNWVTMPDQFTLARFAARLPPDPRPLFAEVALISSHAPWVPVPELLDWEGLGEGEPFDGFLTGAPTPEQVWRDPDRIRSQFGAALAYSLETVLAYAARQGPDGPLMVVLGDHPPAGFVGQTGGPDVPLHMIGPPQVLADIAHWGFVAGLTPDPATPAWPMEAFRDRFLRAFSGAGGGDGA